MSAVEMIKTAIARIKAAKEKLRTWLTSNGVTVPDGTKLDGMVDMLNDVPVSVGGADFLEEKLDMGYMFYNGWRDDILDNILTVCKSVSSMYGVFENNRKREEIDMSHIDATYCAGMYHAFKSCTAKKIFLPKSEKSLVTTLDMAFHSSSVESLDFSSIALPRVAYLNQAFNSSSIKEIIGLNIKLLGLNPASVDNNSPFPQGRSGSNKKLERLTFRTCADGAAGWKYAIDVRYCSFLVSGFVEMVESLQDINGESDSVKSYAKITITGNPCVTGTLSDGTACDVLTDADRAIATSKGWTIVA